MMGSGAHEEEGPLEDVASPPASAKDEQQEQRKQQSGWGWAPWGFSSVLSDLQKAAAEAAEEISKNAMEAAKGAAKGMAELQSTVAESLADKTESTSEAAEAEEASDESESPSERLRKNALKKLEGASKDSTIGHGLKVLDSSMENIALGAFQALGNAWKGSVSLVQKLESSAEQLAGNVQTEGLTAKAGSLAPKLIQSGKELTAKGIKALEYVGKETMDILALETDMENQDSKRDGESALEDATFDHCFYIYGGPEHLEELEALSNHYMLLCNRAKAKMSGEQRDMFDKLTKQVPQALTLGDGGDSSPGSDKGKQVDAASLGDGSEMKSLRESSVSKAAEMATSFTATLGGLAVAEAVQKTADRIEAIKAEGVHRLSELCAVCMSHLLLLGRSLLPGTLDDPSVKETYDGFNWPEDCLSKALMIRNRARGMVTDIEAVADSFVTGIGDVTAAFQAAIKKEMIKDGEQASLRENSIEKKAHSLCLDLQSDGSAAVEKLQDGLQQLVYVVLSTSLKN